MNTVSEERFKSAWHIIHFRDNSLQAISCNKRKYTIIQKETKNNPFLHNKNIKCSGSFLHPLGGNTPNFHTRPIGYLSWQPANSSQGLLNVGFPECWRPDPWPGLDTLSYQILQNALKVWKFLAVTMLAWNSDFKQTNTPTTSNVMSNEPWHWSFNIQRKRCQLPPGILWTHV